MTDTTTAAVERLADDFTQSMDARVWADAFLAQFSEVPDREMLIAWFANAIMCGYDAQATTLRALAAERDALLAAQTWQPIGTANDDGVTKLFLAPSHVPGDPWLFTSRFIATQPKPTHWMPLPPAPGGE